MDLKKPSWRLSMGKLRVSAEQRGMRLTLCDPEAGVMEHAFLDLDKSGGGWSDWIVQLLSKSYLDKSKKCQEEPINSVLDDSLWFTEHLPLLVSGTSYSRNWNDNPPVSDQQWRSRDAMGFFP